jgi:hypothetical protein
MIYRHSLSGEHSNVEQLDQFLLERLLWWGGTFRLRVNVPDGYISSTDVRKWLDQNCNSRYKMESSRFINLYLIYFRSKADAMAFKLVWAN